MKAKDLAQGKWPGVLTALGIDADVLDGKHHPCPKDGSGKDGFRFADRDGTGSFFCHCSKGEKGGIALVMCCKGLTYHEAAKEVERHVGSAQRVEPKQKADPLPRLKRVQGKLHKPSTAVVSYLASRGLELPPGLRQMRDDYWDGVVKVGTFDVMVGRLVSPDGRPLTFHLTYLAGGKKAQVTAPRKMLSPIASTAGGAIRLYPAEPHIGIAEGIETSIAASMLSGIPVWSVINEGGMRKFIPPAGVKEVTIFGDNDASYVGQAAAYECAKRLRQQGLTVHVDFPTEFGDDWNDYLLKMERAA